MIKPWLAVVLAACGSSPVKPPAPAPQPALAPAPAGRTALDFEYGRGGPRDYAKAVAVLSDRCQAGCGDESSCHDLIVLEMRNRGFADAVEVVSLAVAQCDRKDEIACFVAVLTAQRADTVLAGTAALDASCIDHHVARACQAALYEDGFTRSQSSAHAERVHDLEVAGCAAGLREACYERARHPKADDAAAVATVSSWCADGDADACEAIDKPLDPMALCQAGDLDACRMAADNPLAQQIKCRAGFGKDCGSKHELRELVTGAIQLQKLCAAGQKPVCDALKQFSKPAPCPR